MGLYFYYFGFLLVWFNFVSLSLQDSESCVQKSPCICEFANGTGIDLSESATSSSPFFKAYIFVTKNNGAEIKLSTFYYHPCIDSVPKINSSSPDPSKDTCGGMLAVCRKENTMNHDPSSNGTFKMIEGNYEYMGSSNFSSFSPDGRMITYSNGPSSAKVVLICAEVDDRLEVYSLEEPNAIELAFYSRNACLRQIEVIPEGRSAGSTLLIIFFSFVIFYFVLGVCTKKFLMGATGIEVVPNLAFWSDLPNLIKDGWAFAINGFKLPVRSSGPVTSPDPNSYDSI